MNPISIVLLEFDEKINALGKGKELRNGLSVVLQIDDTLWVANDETHSVERLVLAKQGSHQHHGYASQHTRFSLDEYLQLPLVPDANLPDIPEIDIEGLAYADDYLWVIASHSLKRGKPKSEGSVRKVQKALATISSDGNRYLLARIPVVRQDGIYTLANETRKKEKKRTAAQLAGDAHGNALMDALKNDIHLAPFLTVPGKDNGFDIEGLAVVKQRLFLGLRGPVLRGWAIILEIELEQEKGQPSLLRLKPIGPDGTCYRKHFLDLGGLGIRDLIVQDAHFLILAGPTMAIDGPVRVYRWRNGTKAKDESVTPSSDLEHVLEVPYGHGVDHAEGICLYSEDSDKTPSLLIVYDSASVNRQIGTSTMIADVFPLPQNEKK